MRAFCLPEVQCKKSSSERFTRQEAISLITQTSQEGEIGGDETIFGRCEVAESGAYFAYVSIYGASKGRKEAIGTIYKTRSNKFNNTNLPRGEIGGDETIFVLNEGAKAQHSWPM